MKHDRSIEYTLHTGAFLDVAPSRAAARRKAGGWKALGIEVTGVDRVVRETGSGRIISKVCIYTRKGARS